MKKLQKTTRVNGHYHIAYVNDEGGYGLTTTAANHQHRIIYDPPRDPVEPTEAIPPQIDPMTGMPAINPETGLPDEGTPANPGDPGKPTGTWIVEPAEDGHTHDLAEYVVRVKKKKESDEDIINECLSLYKAGAEMVADSKKKGLEAEKFYKGEQWDDSDKRYLEGLNRACLTINEVGKNIDELLGYQMEQRTDLRYLPQEGGDQVVADLLNVLSKRILDSCYYGREESKWFKDQAVVGFGDLLVYMDFKEDIRGEIKVERFPWDCIVYGAHEKEDLSDCEYEVRSKMHSKASLKMLYPKKADKIEKSFDNFFERNSGDKVLSGGTNSDYQFAVKIEDFPQTLDGNTQLVDIAKKEFRLVQCTRKLYEPVSVVVSEEENFFFTAFGWEEKDVEAVQSIPGFSVITQTKTRFRVTKFCGNVVLSDENPADLPVQDFFTVPVYAYRQRGEFWGKVEVAKDPQREINKRRSQTIDIMNRMAASFWFYDEDTFPDGEAERFRKNSSKPGAMFKVNDINRKPVKEEGAQYPSALVEIMRMDQENLQRLMNIVVMQGGANESGTMFLEKKKQRLTGNEFLFDNLAFAKQRLGKLLVALIQRYYDADRIFRIVNTQYKKQPFKIAGQDFKEFSEQQIIDMLENADLTKYDVIVTESSFSPSTRLGVATVLFDLMKNGAPIPPELPLEFIDMPDSIRTRITTTMQQQAENQSATAQTASDTEIVKTLIAKGEYTVSPDKASELGLIPANNNPLTSPEASVDNGSNQSDQYVDNLVSALAG